MSHLPSAFWGKQGRWAVVIAPNYISKAGKKTLHIGRFWSGCTQAVKHGFEIVGIDQHLYGEMDF